MAAWSDRDTYSRSLTRRGIYGPSHRQMMDEYDATPLHPVSTPEPFPLEVWTFFSDADLDQLVVDACAEMGRRALTLLHVKRVAANSRLPLNEDSSKRQGWIIRDVQDAEGLTTFLRSRGWKAHDSLDGSLIEVEDMPEIKLVSILRDKAVGATYEPVGGGQA